MDNKSTFSLQNVFRVMSDNVSKHHQTNELNNGMRFISLQLRTEFLNAGIR
jgi:hypothetical protein